MCCPGVWKVRERRGSEGGREGTLQGAGLDGRAFRSSAPDFPAEQSRGTGALAGKWSRFASARPVSAQAPLPGRLPGTCSPAPGRRDRSPRPAQPTASRGPGPAPEPKAHAQREGPEQQPRAFREKDLRAGAGPGGRAGASPTRPQRVTRPPPPGSGSPKLPQTFSPGATGGDLLPVVTTLP